MCLLYKIHSSLALVSPNDLVLSETSHLAASPSPGTCRRPSTHPCKAHNFLPFKELKTYFCAAFPIPANSSNTSPQHSLAAETANSIRGCISRTTARRWGRHRLSPPARRSLDHISMPWPVWVSPVQERHCWTTASSVMVRTGAVPLRRAWGKGFVQPGAEVALGRPHSYPSAYGRSSRGWESDPPMGCAVGG